MRCIGWSVTVGAILWQCAIVSTQANDLLRGSAVQKSPRSYLDIHATQVDEQKFGRKVAPPKPPRGQPRRPAVTSTNYGTADGSTGSLTLESETSPLAKSEEIPVSHPDDSSHVASADNILGQGSTARLNTATRQQPAGLHSAPFAAPMAPINPPNPEIVVNPPMTRWEKIKAWFYRLWQRLPVPAALQSDMGKPKPVIRSNAAEAQNDTAYRRPSHSTPALPKIAPVDSGLWQQEKGQLPILAFDRTAVRSKACAGCKHQFQWRRR